MIVLELDQVEVDFCVVCNGLWLDGGELELLLLSVTKKEELLSFFSVDENFKEKLRKCPICSKKMQKAFYGQADKVCVDKCQSGHGVWLDKGELDKILKIANSKVGETLTPFLKRVFHKSGGVS